jgi:general secretion pathway protein C
MLTISRSRWPVASATFVLWALVAASAAYWGLKLAAGGPDATGLAATALQSSAADPAAVARVLGASAASGAMPLAPSLSSRFSLVGVVAGRSHQGAALIAVDGKPAKPFRVGSAVAEGLVLQSVEPRRAMLGASTAAPAALTLELPAPRR